MELICFGIIIILMGLFDDRITGQNVPHEKRAPLLYRGLSFVVFIVLYWQSASQYSSSPSISTAIYFPLAVIALLYSAGGTNYLISAYTYVQDRENTSGKDKKIQSDHLDDFHR